MTIIVKEISDVAGVVCPQKDATLVKQWKGNPCRVCQHYPKCVNTIIDAKQVFGKAYSMTEEIYNLVIITGED